MRLVSYRGGRYWGIVEDVTVQVDGRNYHRQRFLINLRGTISEDEARALLIALEEGKAKVCADRFGHKYVRYN